MRTLIVGGGPGGLLLSVLLKRARPDDEVVVFERNQAHDTFGFGVVFSDRTMNELSQYDPEVASALGRHAPRWNEIEVRHPRGTIRTGGHGFTSIARKRLLMLLQQRAADAGVDLRFGTEISAPGQLPEHDLVVAADGINSRVRGWFADAFQPQADVGDAYFMWCGSTTVFDCLTFLFEDNNDGSFGVHAYPFDATTSTFLVETDQASWRAAGLDRHEGERQPPGWNDGNSISYFAKVFEPHLAGGQVLGNNSQWHRFHTIRNATWHHENVALLGDAAHTAHFSVGSGTRMALQDAGELARALSEAEGIEQALARYEERRRPAVEAIQAASVPSMAWWERFGSLLRRQAPPQFVFNFLTRAPRLTRDVLKRRDRSVVEQVDEWWRGEHGLDDVSDTAGLEAPLRLRQRTLPNRVAVVCAKDVDRRSLLIESAGAAVHGAGLVLSAPHTQDELTPGCVETWEAVATAVHTRTPARVGLQLEIQQPDAALTRSLRAVAAADLDLLVVHPPPVGTADIAALISPVRTTWPADRPFGVGLTVAGGRADDELLDDARRLSTAGADVFVVLRFEEGASLPMQRWQQVLISERIRTELGVPTLVVGAVSNSDEANTAVLAGRADVCVGAPQLGTARWRSPRASGANR